MGTGARGPNACPSYRGDERLPSSCFGRLERFAEVGVRFLLGERSAPLAPKSQNIRADVVSSRKNEGTVIEPYFLKFRRREERVGKVATGFAPQQRQQVEFEFRAVPEPEAEQVAAARLYGCDSVSQDLPEGENSIRYSPPRPSHTDISKKPHDSSLKS